MVKIIENTKKLAFYDVKAKKRFIPKKYEIRIKSGRKFAVAKSPFSSIESWRILGRAK